MIHHFHENYVSPNTAVTEIPHISKDRYMEMERELLWLRQCKEKSDRTLSESLIEIKSLTEKLARLKAQNEVLNNCWLKEQQEHIYAQTEARVWTGRAAFKDAEIEELRRQVEAYALLMEKSAAKCLELEEHLNPAREVA